jgi:hypothetical protein
MNRKGILVLGMHRSGTSALTGVLSLAGVTGPRHPILPDANNPKGYFESLSVNRFMESLLKAADSRWHDWRALNLKIIPAAALAQFQRTAVEIAKQEFDAAPLFALKDPRICRAAPFWIETFSEIDAEPLALIPLRHPHAVCLSLAKRDAMPYDKGAILWLRHVFDAERFTRGLKRAFVTFEAVREDPVGALGRVAASLGIGTQMDFAAVKAGSPDLLDEKLVHHREGDLIASQTGGTSRFYEPVWALLSQMAKPDDQPEIGEQAADVDGLDRLYAEFQQATEPFSYYFNTVERMLAQKDAAIAEMQQTLHRTQWALGAIVSTQMAQGSKRLDKIVEEAVQANEQRMAALEDQVRRLLDLAGAAAVEGKLDVSPARSDGKEARAGAAVNASLPGAPGPGHVPAIREAD